MLYLIETDVGMNIDSINSRKPESMQTVPILQPESQLRFCLHDRCPSISLYCPLIKRKKEPKAASR